MWFDGRSVWTRRLRRSPMRSLGGSGRSEMNSRPAGEVTLDERADRLRESLKCNV